MSKLKGQSYQEGYQEGYWEGYSLGEYEVQRHVAERRLKSCSDGKHPICEDTLLELADITSLSIPRIRLIAKQLGLPY